MLHVYTCTVFIPWANTQNRWWRLKRNESENENIKHHISYPYILQKKKTICAWPLKQYKSLPFFCWKVQFLNFKNLYQLLLFFLYFSNSLSLINLKHLHTYTPFLLKSFNWNFKNAIFYMYTNTVILYILFHKNNTGFLFGGWVGWLCFFKIHWINNCTYHIQNKNQTKYLYIMCTLFLKRIKRDALSCITVCNKT